MKPEDLREFGATTAIVLGSGLNPFVDSLQISATIPYSAIPGLPTSNVPGHSGQFAFARLGGNPIVVCQGRVHLYEGWNAREVTAVTRFLHSQGIEKLILTNAAGSLHPEWKPGSWMLIADHLNLTGTSPLIGGPNFVDLTVIYDEDLRHHFRERARHLNLELAEGVYAGVHGPQYETPAEIRMLRTLGADAVGMSTVLEAIQARALGMRVAAFSCLTNWAAGLSGAPLSHDEVTETARDSAATLASLLTVECT